MTTPDCPICDLPLDLQTITAARQEVWACTSPKCSVELTRPHPETEPETSVSPSSESTSQPSSNQT